MARRTENDPLGGIGEIGFHVGVGGQQGVHVNEVRCHRLPPRTGVSHQPSTRRCEPGSSNGPWAALTWSTLTARTSEPLGNDLAFTNDHNAFLGHGQTALPVSLRIDANLAIRWY